MKKKKKKNKVEVFLINHVVKILAQGNVFSVLELEVEF